MVVIVSKAHKYPIHGGESTKMPMVSNPWKWESRSNAHGYLIHGGENLDQMPIYVWSIVVINSEAHRYPTYGGEDWSNTHRWENLWWWNN